VQIGDNELSETLPLLFLNKRNERGKKEKEGGTNGNLSISKQKRGDWRKKIAQGVQKN